jgi:hypothetical protein
MHLPDGNDQRLGSLETARLSLVLAVALVDLGGCTTGFEPGPIDSVPFRGRAMTRVDNGKYVTAAVPDARETSSLTGLSLYRKNVVPL